MLSPTAEVVDLMNHHSLTVGFGTVYLALEGAAKSLAKSLADETVSVVQHKCVLLSVEFKALE